MTLRECAPASSLFVSCVVLLLTSACGDRTPSDTATETRSSPTVKKIPKELEIHGDVRIDNYYWLNERDNPEVIAYLERENAYAEEVFGDHKGLIDRLFEEMKSRIKQQDSTAPYRHGEYFYYRRYEEGQEYPIYCRRRGSVDAEEEVLLDVNKLAGDHEYFAVRGFTVSPDHRKAGFAVDTVGRRLYTLKFIDLETGKMLPDEFEDVTTNFQWAADSQTVFFTKQHPETLRWQWVYRAELGQPETTLVFEEQEEAFSVYVYKSLSGRFVYIASGSTTSDEVRYVDATKPTDAFRVFLAREKDHEYRLTDGLDRFYVLSNKDAENFQLFEAPVDNTERENWSILVPHRQDVLLTYAGAMADHLIIFGRRAGLPYIEIMDRASGDTTAPTLGEEAFLAYPSDNYEYDAKALRYRYESMTTPDSDYDLDLVSGERTLIREQEVPGNFDRNDYHTERLMATARDGTEIPVSLVYRKGMELNGRNPLLLHGYGSYGSNYDPSFSTSRLSLLDRGFVVGIAHIRGGSEMGRYWYLDGRQLNKKNSFTDFIDVSKFLIEQGYTSAQHLYAEGASAGGLLMGAVINMAPELYNGVIAGVPFVDAITTMLDASIPLTAGEFEEWGNPRDKTFYDYMLSYSPYDQVSARDYPNLFVTSGLHDSQVQYFEPAKWVAKLRELKTDDNLLVFKTDMQAGHSGKTGRFQYYEDIALEYGFLLMLEGIAE